MAPTDYSREKLRNPARGGISQFPKSQDCKAARVEPATMLIRVVMDLLRSYANRSDKSTIHVETGSPLQPAVYLLDDFRASSLHGRDTCLRFGCG